MAVFEAFKKYNQLAAAHSLTTFVSSFSFKNETFRNWQNVMIQRKTPEELWESGVLKVAMELWEDKNVMNEEEVLNYIQKNAAQLTSFISSGKSKQKFFFHHS